MQFQFNLTHINTKSGKRLHRQQLKTTLAADLKQGSHLFYIRDKNTGYIFIFSRHWRTNQCYSTRSQEKNTNYPHSDCKRQMDQELKPTER